MKFVKKKITKKIWKSKESSNPGKVIKTCEQSHKNRIAEMKVK